MMDGCRNSHGAWDIRRRTVLLAPALLAVAGCANRVAANIGPARPVEHPAPNPADGPNPADTFVESFDRISFQDWGNLPPGSGEMATLYGDLNQAGPYLVLMKWNPGWFSAPHTYVTDRVCVVVFGTWFVNSGTTFRPYDAVPVGPGGYVKRTAHTAHYDGVPAGQANPAVIAISGLGPVNMQLVDPGQPSWRRV